jgi:hypothetical protein
MFLSNSDAIATASQHQQAGKSKDSGYLLQREGDSGLEFSVNCSAGILIRKKMGTQAPAGHDEQLTHRPALADSSNVLPFNISSQLNCDDIERFSRQVLCNDVGVHGQAAINRGRVLVVGLGGIFLSTPGELQLSKLITIFCRSRMPCLRLRGLFWCWYSGIG